MASIQKQGCVIGVRPGKLEEYIRLHDEQPGKIRALMNANGFRKCRIYLQEIAGVPYLFQYNETEGDTSTLYENAAYAEWLRVTGECQAPFEGETFWKDMRHVYEFKQDQSADSGKMDTQGIIIGVKRDKLQEYIRLHDEQPKEIYDLCYKNGFRMSSIFVAEMPADGNLYLLQFNEFSGKEDPALYDNAAYREWLRVTGECQSPLPGEKFWKKMRQVYEL